ncbi:MAG: hypothetical protein C0501_09725 [Isosphaera sp.]|nr:hypothetical protein [Isosphaera sp.]
MRPRTVGLLGLAGLLSAAGAWGQAPEFKPYASTDGRYKAVFPGPVTTQTVPVKDEKGELTVVVDSVELLAGTSFLVTYVDAPAEFAKQPPGPRLDKVRDGNKGADGKLVEEKDVAVGAEKYPGRDVLIEKPGGHLRNRIVIAGNRLYQVMVQGPKDVVLSPSADRFLASFEVTK